MMDVINMNEMLLMDVKNKTADSPTNNSFKQLSFNDFISVVFIYYFFYSKKSECQLKKYFCSSLFSLLNSGAERPREVVISLNSGTERSREEVVKPPKKNISLVSSYNK